MKIGTNLGYFKAVRVSGTSVGEHGTSFGGFIGGQPVVNICRGVQSDAGVTMLVVVPLGEDVHELSCLR